MNTAILTHATVDAVTARDNRGSRLRSIAGDYTAPWCTFPGGRMWAVRSDVVGRVVIGAVGRLRRSLL